MENKTEFGTSEALKAGTPAWANWTFRIVLLFTTALSGWLATTGLVSEEVKLESVLALKGIDFLVWGISRMFGVVNK